MLKWFLPLLLVFPLAAKDQKLTEDDKLDLLRGLSSEYATAKVVLPRTKKPLPINANTGKYDKAVWDDSFKELGPAARTGDLVQVTHLGFEKEKLVFEINGGNKGKHHWYDNVQVGMGGGTGPVSQRNTAAPGGTIIELDFDKPVPSLSASEIKKLLAPVLDFEKHSAAQQAIVEMPPEVQKAVKENRAIEGMDRDQVILALGKPRTKTREVRDGLELEDWIYGQAPGKITFVTFAGSKVVKVKEAYAGLGGQTAPPLAPVQ